MKDTSKTAQDAPRRDRTPKHACNLCGHKFPSTRAKCPSCGQWNVPGANIAELNQTVLLSEVTTDAMHYIKTGPWDKCFSHAGGIAETSVTLLGGSPGAGKSTLALQISDSFAGQKTAEVLYLGMEQVAKEIRETADRLALTYMHLIRIFPMGCTEDLASVVERYKPCLIVLDSAPGLTSDPEIVVETCEALKQQFAGPKNIPCIVIDHITKDEGFAGLKKLEHAVDTTIMLTKVSESKEDPYRDMVTSKNRFGPQAGMMLEMTATGLIEFIPDDEEI